MKLDVTKVLSDTDGKPLQADQGGRPADLRSLLLSALNHAPKGTSAQEAVDRYRAMQSIASEDTPDVPIETVAKLKETLPQIFRPLLAGQAILMLEGKE